MESGMVATNKGVISVQSAPFGGVKPLGLRREGGFDGIHEFLQAKYSDCAISCNALVLISEPNN